VEALKDILDGVETWLKETQEGTRLVTLAAAGDRWRVIQFCS